MDDPALFKKLSLSYFAAASYSEAARRLGRPERAEGFLLCRHPRFGPEFRACTTLAAARPRGDARADLMARIARLIEPFDVAGLLDSSRRDWYPVRAADLTASASKLDAAVEDIYALLARCGFADSHRLSMSSAGGPTTNNA
jgi:FADH2 O2-dependent halogenase